MGRAFIKGQRYFVEIHLSRGVLAPIYRENRGVTVSLQKASNFSLNFEVSSRLGPRDNHSQVEFSCY